MIQISAKPARVKSKAEVENCDRDLTKVKKVRKKIDSTAIVRRQWMKRSNDEFIWEASQQTSFDHVKRSITKNAMTTTNHELQYHLTADVSKKATDACLFQISEEISDTIMTFHLKNKFKIVMFMSFRLNDVETRYSNTERECLTIVNVLVEIRWLIVESKWKIICYTDHHALDSIMIKESSEYDRIATWQDRLEKYDIKVIHKSTTNSMIEIANELSRLSLKLTTKYRTKDQERPSFMKEDEENIANETNDPMKMRNPNVKRQLTEAIALDDWTQSTRARNMSGDQETNDWQKYDWCSFFKNMMTYLRYDLEEIENLLRQKRKTMISQAFKYSLASEKPLLIYHEKDERRSSCLIKKQIELMLKHLHDEHGHYGHAITLNRMKSETFWSTRTQNVIAWCKSCSACQLNAHKHFTTIIRHILIFESMSMIELNFLDLIKPACAMIECRYILLRVDYFSRFVWARLYVHCTMTESTDLMINLIASIFEWSRAIYSDNDRHFVKYEFEQLLKSRRVSHFTTSVTHSSSIGLIERMIQLMIEDIKKRCVQRDNSDAWALNVTDEVIVINTRKIRVHEHRSCDIMLGFILKTVQCDTQSMKQPLWENEMKKLSAYEQEMMMTLRAENRILALETMIRYQNIVETMQKSHKATFQEGDLVLMRDKARDNQKERKLNVRWKELRMMMTKIKHDLSVWVKSLYEIEKSTRYHVNDLRSWIERKFSERWSITQLINEFSQNQDQDNEEHEKNQLMIAVQTNDEIDSFRTSLTFEMKRKTMIFAGYSDQRALLLWKSRDFWKCD